MHIGLIHGREQLVCFIQGPVECHPSDLAAPSAEDPAEKPVTLSLCFWAAEALYSIAKLHF